MTAFAAEVGEVVSPETMSDLEPGTYELDASLSCYITAMGGVEFGAPLLQGTILTVNTDGTAAMTMNFGTNRLEIYGIPADTYVSTGRYLSGVKEDAYMGILDGEEWIDAAYTLSETVTAAPSYGSVTGESTVAIVDSMTVPVEEVSDSYLLSLVVDSNIMGMQFGKDSKYEAALTVNWAETKVLSITETEDPDNATDGEIIPDQDNAGKDETAPDQDNAVKDETTPDQDQTTEKETTQGTESATDGNVTTEAAKTSDLSFVGLYTVVCLASLGVAVVMRKKELFRA